MSMVAAKKYELYLLRVGQRYKIGVSKDIPARILNLSSHCPDVVHLIHRFRYKAPRALERALHVTFQGRERYGEWFSLTQDDVNLIVGLNYKAAENLVKTTIGKRIGRHKQKDPSCASPPTITVRISRRLGDKIAEFTRANKVDAATHFGPLIESWIKEVERDAKAVKNPTFASGNKARGTGEPQAIVRLWRHQVLRLKSAGVLLGKTITSMIEDKLWEMLA